jgi:hypothetical protein
VTAGDIAKAPVGQNGGHAVRVSAK